MFDILTHTDFETCIGSDFDFVLNTEQAIPLTLIKVTALDAAHNARAVGGRKQPFSLVFRGPVTPLLDQRMYDVKHSALGLLVGLFIVPVAQDNSGAQYEAIFN